MKLDTIKDSAKLFIGKTGFWFKKNSPELLVFGGIAMAAVSVVTACVATTKLNDKLKPINKKIETIKADMNDDNKIANGEYSIKDGRKDLTKAYAKAGLELVKLYGIPVASFGLSVASILGSHKILKDRNLALAAALTTVENGYRSYRERVKEKLGEAVEEEIFKDIREEEVVDEETGEIKKVKCPHLGAANEYSVIFDESCDAWERNGKLNIDYLLLKQEYLNRKLRTYGYLFLKDVYEELGINADALGKEKIRASHIVGWIYDPSDTTRDSYISFGLSDKQGNLTTQAMEMLRNGEKNIWLDFNVDGDILSGEHGNKTFMEYSRSPFVC